MAEPCCVQCGQPLQAASPGVWRCPRCAVDRTTPVASATTQSSAPPTFLACAGCLYPLLAGDRFCCWCGRPAETAAHTLVGCEQCGTRLPPWARFCTACARPVATLTSPPQAPAQGRYRPVEVIGAGGMGVTYKAVDSRTDRVVCLKQLRPHVDVRSLRQEYKALKALQHAGIVQLLDADFDAVEPYIVMEYVRGLPLHKHLAEQPRVPPAAVLSFGVSLFGALGYAHDQSVIHRDLKPANIMVEAFQGSLVPKVLDFGLALVNNRDDLSILTAEGRPAGTPSYMAPEQVVGRQLDGACDVYAAGQILWEMYAGRPAFESQNVVELGLRKLQTDGLRFGDGDAAPEDLAELLRRATLLRPEQRPTASEMHRALQAVGRG